MQVVLPLRHRHVQVRVPPQTGGVVIDCEASRGRASLGIEGGDPALGEPVVAEASASGQDTLAAMEAMGYSLLCESGYQIVDLERSERVRVPVEGGRLLSELETFKLAVEADVIISLSRSSIQGMGAATAVISCT